MTIKLDTKAIKQFAWHALLATTLSAICTVIVVTNPGLLRFVIQVVSFIFRR